MARGAGPALPCEVPLPLNTGLVIVPFEPLSRCVAAVRLRSNTGVSVTSIHGNDVERVVRAGGGEIVNDGGGATGGFSAGGSGGGCGTMRSGSAWSCGGATGGGAGATGAGAGATGTGAGATALELRRSVRVRAAGAGAGGAAAAARRTLNAVRAVATSG